MKYLCKDNKRVKFFLNEITIINTLIANYLNIYLCARFK